MCKVNNVANGVQEGNVARFSLLHIEKWVEKFVFVTLVLSSIKTQLLSSVTTYNHPTLCCTLLVYKMLIYHFFLIHDYIQSSMLV